MTSKKQMIAARCVGGRSGLGRNVAWGQTMSSNGVGGRNLGKKAGPLQETCLTHGPQLASLKKSGAMQTQWIEREREEDTGRAEQR